jgi:hypothetical protein
MGGSADVGPLTVTGQATVQNGNLIVSGGVYSGSQTVDVNQLNVRANAVVTGGIYSGGQTVDVNQLNVRANAVVSGGIYSGSQTADVNQLNVRANAVVSGGIYSGSQTVDVNQLQVRGNGIVQGSLTVAGTTSLGWERVEQTGTVAANPTQSYLPNVATCPAGKMVTGGGAEIVGGDATLRRSRPTDDNHGWEVIAAPTGLSVTLTTYAICMRIAP